MTKEDYILELKSRAGIEDRQIMLYTVVRLNSEIIETFPHILDLYYSNKDSMWIIRSTSELIDKHQEPTLAAVYGYLYKTPV